MQRERPRGNQYVPIFDRHLANFFTEEKVQSMLSTGAVGC
jgi:hypothetical protein